MICCYCNFIVLISVPDFGVFFFLPLKTYSKAEKDLFSIGLAYLLLGCRQRTTRAYKFTAAVVKWPANLSLSPTDETSFEAGIKVQIHTQDEPPFIDQLGFGVAPGFQTFVSCQEQRVSPGDGRQKIIMRCIGDKMKEKSEKAAQYGKKCILGFPSFKRSNERKLKPTATDGVTLHVNMNSILVLFVLPAV